MEDPTNRDRASWAANALDTFQSETGADAEDAVSDLLCDLMHLCDTNRTQETFTVALYRARGHYDAETEERS